MSSQAVLIGGKKRRVEFRVKGGPMAGTLIHMRDPKSAFARVPIQDDDGGTLWMMFKKEARMLVWRGWSTDSKTIEAPAGTGNCKTITNRFRKAVEEMGFKLTPKGKAEAKKARIVTPEDLGGEGDTANVWGDG